MRLKQILHTVLAAALLTGAFLLMSCSGPADPGETAGITDTGDTFAETTEAQLAVPEEEFFLNYKVSPADAGYISGIASQTLLAGEKSTTVEAVASAGYQFVEWSDGTRNAVHRPMSVKESQTVYAIFEQVIDSCPVVYITTEDGKSVESDWRTVGCTISVDNIEKRYIVMEAAADIKCRGNASMGWPKKSYTIRFTESQKLGGLGEGKSKNWVLVSNHCDQSLLRNHAAFWLQRNMDGIEWAPDCRPVDVYLNGDYRGNYMLIEKVTVNEDRINIVNGKENPAVEADFMVELDNYANKAGDNGIVWFTAKSFPYEIRGEDNLTKERCEYIDKWVTDAYVTACDGTEAEIRAVLDIDSLVDTYLVEEIMKNIDCGWSSFFLYRRDGKLYFGPGWDFDLAAGNDARLDNGSYKNIYAGDGRYYFSQQNPWFLRLMEKDWFRVLAAERYMELEEKGIFEGLFTELDRVYETCKESFEHNFEKWPIFGQTINQEPRQIRDLDSVDLHFNYLKEWLGNRIVWLYEEYSSYLS